MLAGLSRNVVLGLWTPEVTFGSVLRFAVHEACRSKDWTGDGKADLVYIKTRNTGTNSVEVHVADAASNYQDFVLQTGACFGCEYNGVWTLSRKGDLVYIKTRNCDSGKIEYHVASKASNYQQFTQHVATDFDVEDNGTWCIAPTRSGDFDDLYSIKTGTPGREKSRIAQILCMRRPAAASWVKSKFILLGKKGEIADLVALGVRTEQVHSKWDLVSSTMKIEMVKPAPRDGVERCQYWILRTVISLEAEEIIPAGTSERIGNLVGQSANRVAGVVGDKWIQATA